jgi:hypothetical protein
MRARVISGVLAAFAAAALPAAAQAGSRTDYRQVFSTPVPGVSTGHATRIVYKHPQDPDAKPIPVRREVFTFPEGTGFDNSVVPYCTASDEELEQKGEAACPPESRVGGGVGDTVMTGFPGAGESPLELDGWNYGSGVLLLGATSQAPGLRMATRARRRGRVVTVDVPPSFGGPPDWETAIRRVLNVFGARSIGRRAYVRTPSFCPSSGVWTFKVRFTWADGVVTDDVSRMPCKRDLTPPRIRIRRVPRRRCIARGFRVHVSVRDASPLKRVHLRLDGRLLRATTATRFKAKVRVRRLRTGRHRLSVIARDAPGNRARRTVRFRRCARV